MKKIVLVGPVYPYKGGIAHYTGLMCRAFMEKYDVSMISYKMQYPKVLFHKEQRDYTNDTFKIEGTDYLIHTADILNCIRSGKKIRSMNPDLVIIQWWHPYFAPCYWLLCRQLKKQKVLFVCHNVFPHERFPLDRFLTKKVMKQGDYFIVHSGQDKEDLLSIKPDARCAKAVHPTYNAFKLQDLTKEQGRELLKLNEDQPVLLFFGFVREYKGLKYLLQAMPEVRKQLPDVKLLVVGDFDGDKDQYEQLIREVQIEDAVEIHDGYIPDKEVEKFFAASDLVVLPYISATQSGIVQIAYGFDKPVIATNVGGLPEVVLDGKTGYIVEPEDANGLSERIVQFFTEHKDAEFRDGIRKEADRYSWERMVETIEELVEND